MCILLLLLDAVPSEAQNYILLHQFDSYYFHLVYTLREYLGSTATQTHYPFIVHTPNSGSDKDYSAISS